MTRRAFLAGAAAALGLPRSAWAADEFRSRRVRLIVPFAAGGTLDILARLLGEKLSERWGPRAIVENRPGAAGIIASKELLSSPPDGHSLLLVAGGHAINPLLHASLPYDTLSDFMPVSLLAEAGNVVVVGQNSPLKSFAQFLAEAKANPGKFQYGTAGIGSSVHLSGELLARMADIRISPVHFRGDSESLTAAMGGHIPLSFNSAPAAIAQVGQGGLRALAVTSAARLPNLPDVPTIAEAGVPGFEVTNWWGVVAPSGLRPEILARLGADIAAAGAELRDSPKVRDLGIRIVAGPPAEFDALIRRELERWRPVIEAAGIKAG
ncbi:Bug family tripartite tricarboxylate transporter substrate binding protein [Enterovirga aerilata]|uniref:Tripartite tricarboxylate transporter substrate binding protein n=1 Tax=Enterovirga aerilata TaxID=2730920 RepID=A0A849I2T7_9HYPH|nr:tripartite tricarboxylate transporter substrate binding protein [Enterovirga sp. DB1703]NNM74116.1 tripartite tricarboxylate transporter substrate binding protein [Enterovirga sp. DB1703]